MAEVRRGGVRMTLDDRDAPCHGTMSASDRTAMLGAERPRRTMTCIKRRYEGGAASAAGIGTLCAKIIDPTLGQTR